MMARLARLRVPLGFASAAVAYWLAQPSWMTILTGALVAIPGEAIRLWASGHIEKGREITRSGPYRFVRHPLYVGSAIMGAGFAVASASWIVAALVAVYLGLTLTAAILTEEATLDARFDGGYAAYREGRAEAVQRSFSAARVAANHEYRTLAGLATAFLLLIARMYLARVS